MSSRIDFEITHERSNDFRAMAVRLNAIINGQDCKTFEAGQSSTSMERYQLGSSNDFWLRRTDEAKYSLSARYATEEELSLAFQVFAWRWSDVRRDSPRTTP